MKYSIKFGLIGLVIVCFISAIKFNVVSSKGTKEKLVVNTEKIIEDSNKIVFDLKYPQIKLKDENVQNKINNLIKQHVYEFKKDLEGFYKATYENENDTDLIFSYKFEGLSDFKYEVVSDILSLTISFSQFTGGAHPMTYVRDYNFDLNTGKLVQLNELFNEEGKKIYKKVIDNFIIDQINKNPENYFKDEFKGIKEDSQFYLTKDSIVVFFQLYEIAPYSSGITEFKIPFSSFGDVINIK